MSVKEHGNIGNQNAKKEDAARHWLQVRLTSEEKERIKEQAKKAGMTISNYVRSKIL